MAGNPPGIPEWVLILDKVQAPSCVTETSRQLAEHSLKSPGGTALKMISIWKTSVFLCLLFVSGTTAFFIHLKCQKNEA